VLSLGEEAAELLWVLLADTGGCSLGLKFEEVLLDCAAIAPDVADPVVLEAWLLGL
jgi:hypothetical protein